MSALVDLPTYQSIHSLSPADMATILDTSGDSTINNADLQALISLVANSPAAAAPAAQMNPRHKLFRLRQQ